MHIYLYYNHIFTDTLDQVNVTSSISGRKACPSEEVTFTCSARGGVIFWGNEEFGEITVHYLSPPSMRSFQAVVVSYNESQNCLVSSLSFRATASRNGTTVNCTNRDRTSNQSLSLHIMSSESVRHILAVNISSWWKHVLWKQVSCAALIIWGKAFSSPRKV